MKRSGRFSLWELLPGARRTILRAGREEGTSLFEFAMVLPLLMVLLVGIIKAGIYFYDYVVLADAVATGARTLATNRQSPNGNPCTLAETALKNAAYDLNQSLITVQPETFTGTGGSTCAALQPNDAATMSATYPCDMTIPFLGSFWPNCTLSSQTTVRIE
jgi:Flp pilus assembly protein TadG